MLIEGMNHVLKLAPPAMAGQMMSYQSPDVPLAPALTEAIVRFVNEVTG